MRKDNIKLRILILSSLPVVTASLILLLSGVSIIESEYLIFAACLTLLVLALVLYVTLHKVMVPLTVPQQHGADHVSTAPLDQTSGTVDAREAEGILNHGSVPGINHELRIPLNNIIGFTNLLLQTGLSGKQAEYLNTIKDSSESLLTLVNSILDNSNPRASNNERDYKHLGVLAVDDNQLNLRLVCTLLEDMDIAVTAAHSGEEAVRQAAENHFDLILMDVQMPGMNGIEAMNRIRDKEEQGQKTPVVALTAHALPDEVMHLLDAGMDDYVVKPISKTQLEAILDKWIAPEAQIRTIGESTAKAIVDWKLCLRLANNKSGLAQELLAILKQTLPDDQLAISNAFAAEETELLQQQIHRLKGAVKYCGVPGLHQAVEQFEITVKAGDSIQSSSALNVLNREIDLFMDWWRTSDHPVQ